MMIEDRMSNSTIYVIGIAALILLLFGYVSFGMAFKKEEVNKSRAHTCEIIANRTTSKFEVVYYDEFAQEKVQGFFPTREEAFEYTKTSILCKDM